MNIAMCEMCDKPIAVYYRCITCKVTMCEDCNFDKHMKGCVEQ